ncbi:DUF3152 domain-containing protein [Streptomyces sp. NBC_01551]|uniref:DUF3152 domain-containing protein n=1 Tax=Streptomyces sp. NBC_01551 TaxID=2975876 RepID=UPI002257B4AF|nr:DUF3152 domain-containing protein [Streptomyces sp. NBC_01551]MCX4527927.1 DUF3152 domain-containing protein [Streptomyces sp. NBC_01551]
MPPARPGQDARDGGHPQLREPGGAWGAVPAPSPASASGAVYGDWRGVPRARSAGSAAGFPQATLAPPEFPDLEPAAVPAAAPGRALDPDPGPVTSTGSHRRVPGPRKPADPVAPSAPVEEQRPPGTSRGTKVRTYTGMAAAAVTTVLAVVVAGQVVTGGKDKATAISAGDDGRDRAAPGQSAASRGDGRSTPDAAAPAPVPAAPELTFEQKMAQQLPIDAKLKGPGTFDTVPGLAKAPGKGRLVRYRVDVEQGLGLDPQLFAEAVQRTLNDDRSWAHKGAMTFERVSSGKADFVITLASPGTTGVWCAKSDLDTVAENVSCDSASTERVMINAFRWAQGSTTYGAGEMFAYRQMLINHEVGHRLGHGHVNCQTPGALAPIMQQQTKSLDIGGIRCKANPWVFPGS